MQNHFNRIETTTTRTVAMAPITMGSKNLLWLFTTTGFSNTIKSGRYLQDEFRQQLGHK